jgi:regulatory protein
MKKELLEKVKSICAKKETCAFDIEKKLSSWGEKNTKPYVEALVKENYINNKRYVAAFVKDKFHLEKWGKLKISSALKTRKIPENLIQEGLSQIDDVAYIQLLDELLAKKRNTITDKSILKVKSKLFRFAASRGFEYDLIYAQIDSLFEK